MKIVFLNLFVEFIIFIIFYQFVPWHTALTLYAGVYILTASDTLYK